MGFALLALSLGCGAPPDRIDVRAALMPVCDRTPDVFVAGADLAVFEGPPPTLAANLVVGRGLVLDGEPVQPGALEERLREKVETGEDLRRRVGLESKPHDLIVQIAPTTAGGEIVSVLDTAVSAGFTSFQLVGKSAEKPVLPQFLDPELGAKLLAARELPIMERRRARDALVDSVYAECPAVLEALDGIPRSEKRCETTVGVLEKVLPSCPNGPQIVTLFQEIGVPLGDALTTIRFAHDPAGPVVEVGANEAWATIVPRVQASPGRGVLRAKP